MKLELDEKRARSGTTTILMTFQKIEQMFDQNLIDYCNPPQNFLGGFEVNAHRCLTLFQYLQRSFLEI